MKTAAILCGFWVSQARRFDTDQADFLTHAGLEICFGMDCFCQETARKPAKQRRQSDRRAMEEDPESERHRRMQRAPCPVRGAVI
jgi:hypothetical protein